MGEEGADAPLVPWRYKSRGSFYYWCEGRTFKNWRLSADRFGQDAGATLGLQGLPHIALRDEAHARRACRRCTSLPICEREHARRLLLADLCMPEQASTLRRIVDYRSLQKDQHAAV